MLSYEMMNDINNASQKNRTKEYLTVKDLKKLLSDPKIKDDAKIYYERIEDEYFEENGWQNDELLEDLWYNRGPERVEKNKLSDNWISAYEIFYNEEENTLKITAHY